jgi:hypothetical protein
MKVAIEQTVVITMPLGEARELHNQAYAARNPSMVGVGGRPLPALDNLIDALTAAKVQLP